MTITFGVGQVHTYAAKCRDGEQALPEGEHLEEVIGTAGDRFRDSFTRLCLYATRRSEIPADYARSTVVVGTEYGNAEALARLQREAPQQGRRLSPQAFPQAISGAAAASVAMATGATGANVTLGANLLTPVVALWQALRALEQFPNSACRLLVGDVYSEEAQADALRHEPDLSCRSGIAHAVLACGDEFSAAFDFSPATAATSSGHRIHIEDAATGAEPRERNGAVALGRFLRRIAELPVGDAAVLECQRSPTQRAAVQVTRVFDHAADPGRSER